MPSTATPSAAAGTPQAVTTATAPPALPPLARRMDGVVPFYVMQMAADAADVAASSACDPAAGGSPMLYLNIGEPDFPPVPAVAAAARTCIDGGRIGYTPALGIPALRAAVARWYAIHYGLDIDPRRVAITAGASAALQLVCLALLGDGDDVLMPDPCYPCNVQFVQAAGARPRLMPTTVAGRFQLDDAVLADHWSAATRAVLLASPCNPTGTSVDGPTGARIAALARARGAWLIADEIYQGLSFDARYGTSMLAHDRGHVVAINSFSKYFAMTGWRLGWVVLPEDLVEPVERLAQHLYVCPSALAQQAALACFEPSSLAICAQRRGELQRRRDLALQALRTAAIDVPVEPDGAFFVWADVRSQGLDSAALCDRWMRQAHVVATPGHDFSARDGGRFVRFAFAGDPDAFSEALDRIRRLEPLVRGYERA